MPCAYKQSNSRYIINQFASFIIVSPFTETL